MPKLSVIVIAFNNELYIEEALESLHQQTFTDFEVVVVNDASTDNTQSIIESYIEGKENFRLINLETNSGGCSVPRNTGINASTGEYLMFLDGDDWYTSNACEKMVEAITKYDSDFVAGEVVRTNNYQTWYKKMIFAKPRINFNVREFNDVLYDSLSVNKIYKRSFLDFHQLRFPEGIHYEDVVFTGKAYFLAERISIICEPIYYWRVVENAKEKSISNRRNEIENLLNRLKAHRIYDQFLLEHKEYTSIQKKNTRFLKHDLRLYLKDYRENVLTYDAEFKDVFKEKLSKYLNETFKKQEFFSVPEELKISAYLLKERHFDVFEAYMLYLNDQEQNVITLKYDDNIYYLDFPALDPYEKRYMKTKMPRMLVKMDDVHLDEGFFKFTFAIKPSFVVSKEDFEWNLFVHHLQSKKKVKLTQSGEHWMIDTKELEDGNYHVEVEMSLLGYQFTIGIKSADVNTFKLSSEKHSSKIVQTYISPKGYVGFRVKQQSAITKVKKTVLKKLSPVKVKMSQKAMKLAKNIISRLPVKKDWIYFESHMGKQYSDSPKYIFEELLKQNKKYRYIWGFTDPAEAVIPTGKVKKVKKGSLTQYYYQARAKYWFDNQGIGHIVTKKKNQIYTQTWHGTPLKKMGYDKGLERTSSDAKRLANQVKQWDYFISPNRYSTEIFKRAFDVRAKFLTIGYPRNDVLVNAETETNEKVRKNLNISKKAKVILYAPTFRDWNPKAHLKMKQDIMKLSKELPENHIILLRLHYLDEEKIRNISLPQNVMNVSAYMDIQELYCASDILITDYSSVMFDYAFLKKPMYFYCYDLDEYVEKRGTYFDLKELPGKTSHTLPELLVDIREERTEPEKYQAFIEKFCSKDTGKASKEIIKTLRL